MKLIITGLVLLHWLVSPGHAQSRNQNFYDADGRYVGSAVSNGHGTTTYFDGQGRYAGASTTTRRIGEPNK
jgi:hypothetical protein